MARLLFDPGIIVGMPAESPEQTIEKLIIDDAFGWGSEGKLAFGELDPVSFSERVRDLEGLRG